MIRRDQLEAANRVAAALPAALASVDASVAEGREALGRAEAERATRNAELQGIRRDEAVIRDRLHAVTEDVHGLELRIYEKKLHVGGLVERAESESSGSPRRSCSPSTAPTRTFPPTTATANHAPSGATSSSAAWPRPIASSRSSGG